MNTDRILYDYITATREYGDIVNFSDKSGIPLIDLNAVLVKDNVSKEICMGLTLCKILNIDIGKMVFDGQIKNCGNTGNNNNVCVREKRAKSKQLDAAAKHEIYSKCMRLSEIEKKKVLEYIDGMLDEKYEDL